VELVVVLVELVTVPLVLWAMAGVAKAKARRTSTNFQRLFFITGNLNALSPNFKGRCEAIS